MLSLLIKNCTVATSSETFRADIGIEGEVVRIIAGSIDTQADRTINAEGKLVLPGAIDGHTHFEMPFMGTTTADDFASGTSSAAAGGVTTIIDFALQQKGETLRQAFEAWHSKASGKSITDYGFHVIFRDFNEGTLSEIKDMIEAGVNSFKVFTTYRREGLMLDDGQIQAVMKEVATRGGLVAVHAENNGMAERNVESFIAEGKTSALYHALSKPRQVEGEAVQRMVYLAKITNCPMYVVHLSSGVGREFVRRAQLSGYPVFAETCPHYLVFDDSVYSRPDAAHFVMSPPIKGEHDRASLWEGLVEGDIKTVASDHADFTSEQKAMGRDDFRKIPNGVAGTEVILPILFSEGYAKKRFSLNRLVQVTSTNAAKAYNLFPRKGTVVVGGDADLVLIDPKKRVRLTADVLHARLDYSIYDSYTTEGYPVMTISRGEVIVEEGQVTGKQGRGRYLHRKPFQDRTCPLFAS
jgi:dihydropyrimidinase